MLLASGAAFAQDALRYSLAGDAAAEAQRQQMASQPYTWKTGDFRLLLVPSVEMDYNDNVTISKTDPQSDFILKPLLQMSGSYPITQQNFLSFSAGVGYDEYLRHSRYSAMRVNSDSQLLFDMRVKDFLFDFHDRFSFYEDPSAEAALAGTATYGGLQNTAGLAATWDLEQVVLTLGYDHQNFISSSEQFSYLNRASELPLVRAGYQFDSRLTAGVEGGASFTSYDQEVLNDNSSYSAGVYADWKLGPYFEVQPRAGYTVYQFQHTSQPALVHSFSLSGAPIVALAGESIQTADLDAWYASLTLSHEVSKAVSYGLSAGHEIRLGIQSDVIEDWYFKPNISWNFIKDVTLNTSPFYEHGNQGGGNVSGNLTETYDWYGGEVTLSYPLMKKLMLSLNYRLTLRSSDIPDRDYAQNIVGIKLAYQPQ
jgi:outer membrane protein assembly factor BamA